MGLASKGSWSTGAPELQRWVERASRRPCADVGVRIDYELGGTGLGLSRMAVGVPEGWKASSWPPRE